MTQDRDVGNLRSDKIFERGWFSLCRSKRRRGGLLRFGTACLLGLLLCGTAAGAADMPHEGRMLLPVGQTVGIKLFARGVVVARLPEGRTPARSCGLREGDVILACGGEPVTSTEQFQSLIQRSGKTETELEVRRRERNLTLPVTPERKADGAYGIGAWVRDSMAGIGTMTYYDPANGSFGALGHGITDTDTALLMPFSNGSILPAGVKAVRRGEVGKAGELRGDFDLQTDLGPLWANTENGIFGTLTGTPPTGKALPAGTPRPGKAVLLSNAAGGRPKPYEIEILKTDLEEVHGRNLVLSVTDPALIDCTGGIVQGMSGSPILQDGRLVGAVTHVLLNDPTKGYGISMDSMLSAAN